MAKGSGYRVPYRRRREGKTDYHARKAFVLSGKPRLVARCSLKNVIVQIVNARPTGDEIVFSAQSRELSRNYGWQASRGNIPAAYLTGLLCGLKAKIGGADEAILDLGLHSPSKGARVFAVLKGMIDAGIDIPHGKEKLPDEKRIGGEHITKYAKSLAPNAEQYQARFSKYIERKINPENLPEHFTKVKKEILASFKNGGKEA